MSSVQSGRVRSTQWLTIVLAMIVTVGCNKPTPPEITQGQPTPAASISNESPAIADVDAGVDVDSQVDEAAPVDETAPVHEVAPVDDAALEDVNADSEVAGREEAEQSEQVDDSFRLWLPTTAGGMLVRLRIQTGERSLRTAFDGRIDEVLTDAGVVGGGAWDDLLQHIAAAPATFGNLNTGGQSKKQIVGVYDRNRNRRPDREEVVNLLFRDSGFAGPFRMAGTDAFRQLNRSQSLLFRALDLNSDQRLNSDEIDRAYDSLRSMDRNGDQRIDQTEVTEANRDGQPNEAWNRRNSTRWGHVAMDLVGYVDWSMFANSLAELSHNELSRQAVFHDGMSSLANLDRDGDQSLNAEEAKTLLTVEPDLTLTIDLTQLPNAVSTTTSPSIKIAFEPNALGDRVQVTEQGDRARIRSDRFQLLVTVRDQYASSSTSLNPLAPSTAPSQERDSPIWGVQVRARGAEVPDAIFAWLDENADGSLSTRELKSCSRRLQGIASEDVSTDDGVIRPDDLPDTFLIQFIRGEPQQDAFLFDDFSRQPSVKTEWPRWAASMDRNQDGDIAADEFLGDVGLFERLDNDRDGFLDAAETLAAN